MRAGVVRRDEGDPEGAGAARDQGRAVRGAGSACRDEKDGSEDEPQRPHEQQPEPNRLDPHEGSLEPRSCETRGISWRRLVPLVLVVTALLAVVAFVAHGRPLGSGAGTGGGLPQTFWDFVFTTILIVVVLWLLGGLATLVVFRRELARRERYRPRTIRTLAIILVTALILVLAGRHFDLRHLLRPNRSATATSVTTPEGIGKSAKLRRSGTARQAQFRWEELAIVLGLLLVVGAAAAVTRKRLEPPTERVAPELLAAALDESLDDLRDDPDLRRAIVAAYARMVRALAAAGLPRHHAEAPLEYMERALLALDTSAAAVRRLTDLFEWARFSQHEPEPSMRDDAVDALVAVRDELRAVEWAVT